MHARHRPDPTIRAAENCGAHRVRHARDRRRQIGRDADRAHPLSRTRPGRTRHRQGRRQGDPPARQGLDRRQVHRRRHHHRRHRLHRARRDAGSGRAAVREEDGRLCHHVPAGEREEDRHVGDPDARHRRRRQCDIHLLPARLAGRLQGRLGRDPGAPARLPLPALQFRGNSAAARRASAAAQGQGRDRLAFPLRCKTVGWPKHPVGGVISVQDQPRPVDQSLAELKTALAQRERELDEARAHQAATAAVLKAITGSRFDLAAVLDKLIDSACRLCEAEIGTIRYEDGAGYRLAATFGCRPEWREHFAGYSAKPDRTSVFGQTILKGGTIHIPDVLEDRDYARPVAQKLMGLRAALGVPLMRDGRVFGVVNLFRTTPRPFTDRQIELAETFSTQAVIAIENARLFEAEEQRSAELAESLAQQTATSEVLKVISTTPGDVTGVFDNVLLNALRLCEASFGLIHLCEGKNFRPVAIHNIPPALAAWQGKAFEPAPEDPLGRVFATKQKIHIADVRAEQAYQMRSAPFVALVEGGGARTLLLVPLIKDGGLIGTIGIYRQEVREFSAKHIALVESFAAQAVIAIENARLLNELRETLERQTATSEVLKVISSSPGELERVFDAMLENATRICQAELGALFLLEGQTYRAVSVSGESEYTERTRASPTVDMREIANADTPLHRLLHDKKLIHIHDLRRDRGYLSGHPRIRALVESAGARTHLVVPMLKDETLVGAVVLYRREVRPFADKQIELVENFAAQAVIAIENARLLSELRETLERQTATSEVLKVIAGSPADAQPVFDAIAQSAARLFGGQSATVTRVVGDEIHLAALTAGSAEGIEAVR